MLIPISFVKFLFSFTWILTHCTLGFARYWEISSGSDSLLKEMANLGLFSGTKSMKSVNVSFRLPYYTQWGQSLLVCGSERVLGSWNVKKGLLLSPVHQGDELIWCGSVAVPREFSCEYNYYVVDDEKNVLRWEMGTKRTLLLPEGINGGETVGLHDLWQVILVCSIFCPSSCFMDWCSLYIFFFKNFFSWHSFCPHYYKNVFKGVVSFRCPNTCLSKVSWNLSILKYLNGICKTAGTLVFSFGFYASQAVG